MDSEDKVILAGFSFAAAWLAMFIVLMALSDMTGQGLLITAIAGAVHAVVAATIGGVLIWRK